VTQIDYKEIEKRLTAATAVFSDSSSTIDKVRSAVSLLVGIHPRTDALCSECLRQLDTVGRIERGELTELAANALPEETDEQKRRKKALLLLLKGWKDLQAEVARVQQEFQAQKQGGSQSSMWGRIFSATKGPLAIITLIAIGIAAMSATSVDIVIKNQGCSTFVSNGSVPIAIPGLVIPTEPIESGGSAVATIPPLTLTIDGSDQSVLKISSLKLSFSIKLTNAVSDVLVDSASVLGTQREIKLSDGEEHTVTIVCGV
jgi:hypothetical protein